MTPRDTEDNLRRLRPEEWEDMRQRLAGMHENMSNPQIKAVLKTEGVDVTEKQLKDRFKKWKLKQKNIRRDVLDSVLGEMEKAGAGIPRSGFVEWNGLQIPAHKLHRRKADRTRDDQRLRNTTVDSVAPSTPDIGGSFPPRPALGPSPGAQISDAPPLRSDPKDSHNIAKNVWRIRVFAGAAVWFYDYLRLCCDPELSPLPSNSWAEAMKDELGGYTQLFLQFNDGSHSSTRTARAAFIKLKAALDTTFSDTDSEDDMADDQVSAPRYKALYVVSQLHYPAQSHCGREQIRAELERFEGRMAKMTKSFNKLISRLQTEGRRRVKADARPFRNNGSPAAFYHRLRQVVLHLAHVDIFEDPHLNFSQIRALHPGPRPGPSICFFDDTSVVPRVVVQDPVLFDDAEDYNTESAGLLLDS